MRCDANGISEVNQLNCSCNLQAATGDVAELWGCCHKRRINKISLPTRPERKNQSTHRQKGAGRERKGLNKILKNSCERDPLFPYTASRMRNTLLDYTARNITRYLSDCQLLCSLLRAPVSLVQLTLNQHSLSCYELHHARGELAQCRATSRQESCRGASSPTTVLEHWALRPELITYAGRAVCLDFSPSPHAAAGHTAGKLPTPHTQPTSEQR